MAVQDTDRAQHEAKIVSLDDLEIRAADLRRRGRRIVMCHGTFDLLHLGHIRHLQRAAREGDVLVVTVTADAYVNKGPGRPVFGEHLRAEAIAALACVDFVAINSDSAAMGAITRLQPDVYVKGQDYRVASDDVTGNIQREREAVEAVGGRIFFTDEVMLSSSGLLNEHFGVFSSEARQYLRGFQERCAGTDVVSLVRGLSGLRILVVGDTIIDQYCYIKELGQVGKGTALAVKYEGEEQFAGGAVAVANHLAGFVDHVTLVTGLGRLDTQEAFVRSKLLPGVVPSFFYVDDAPTVTKRRFVDADLNKLFEVYFCSEAPLPPAIDAAACSTLAATLAEFDVVIVPDFGNGFISAAMVETLCRHSRFLAVNAQLNSGNRGHHVVGRYRRADFVSINEPELRLAAHNRHDPIESIAETIGARLGCLNIAITCGSRGVMFKDRVGGAVHRVPALSTKVIDRLGAGDAFLALAGLCLGGGLSAEVSAFVGSAAAALDVQIVGNRDPIGRAALFKYMTTLLK